MSSETVTEETTTEEITFDSLWETFSTQLEDCTAKFNECERKINEETASCNRIDLQELNTLKIAKHKLEAALEALDLVRVHCLKMDSLINYK